MSQTMTERFLPAPEAPEMDGFNPHATIPFGVTTAHLYESMKEFTTFVGFIDAQLRAQKMARFEDILMAANFNGMVGEFMSRTIPIFYRRENIRMTPHNTPAPMASRFAPRGI